MTSMLIKVVKVISVASTHCWPLVLFAAPAFIGFFSVRTVLSVVRVIDYRVNRVVRITRGYRVCRGVWQLLGLLVLISSDSRG
jgi:hypothetical protein